MAKKKAAKRPAAKKAGKVARKPVKAARKAVAKKTAKKSTKRVPKKAAKKSTKPAAKKVVKAAAKKSPRKTASAPKPAARPVKLGVGSRRGPRDESAGIRIAPTQPERITHAPKLQPAPLKMPFAVPLERPIAPLELRPTPLFEREMFSHDDEE